MATPPDPALLEVGRVTKPHGIRGEVIVDLVSDRTERMAPGSVLTVGDRTLEVETSRPHQGKWIVAFGGVHDRNGAEALRGAVLRGEPIADPDVLWVHELVGAAVETLDGTGRGTVVAVEANPASDLLVLDTGALVPLRFVTERDPGRVVVDTPEGLFDD